MGLILGILSPVCAQINPHNTEWMRYLENGLNEEETDAESLADLYDELSYMVEHPYNLQTVGKGDLEKLPFLSAQQIENLLYYIYRYGPLVDLYELKNVEDLDLQTITCLLPFVYVGAVEMENTASSGYQELLLRTNFTVQEKAGYTDGTYLGDSYYLNFRYNGSYKDKLQWGISGEKDSGEPFWNAYNKGVDYYTFNLTWKNTGILEALHIGNYRLSFGQGLVMNTNFSMGKTSDAVSINRKSTGIQRHISTNESQYFRGVAGTLHKNDVRLSLFYSNRNQDATADDTTVYTFKTDGYHRTYNDWLKRKTVDVELYGANVQWQIGRWALGSTAVHYSFGDKTLNPDLKPYNLFYLRGKNHFNAGFNYSYQAKKGGFQGETAVDNSGKIATVNNLSFKPASFIDWVLSFRYYDKQYNALYGKGFSESSTLQNETGVYTGMKIRLLRQLELSTYLDYFRFPWLKYETATPSYGRDLLLQLKYNCRPNLQMNVRYRFKTKDTNSLPYEQHRWRYQLDYTLNKSWYFNTQADYTIYTNEQIRSQGWSLTQSFDFAPDKSRFQLDGSLAYFHTGDWNTRISVYEKNVLYAVNFPTYYGHGLRYYAVVKWKIIRSLTVYFKCGSTHYFDRTSIGSGPESIQGREKTDIYLLLKYHF
jgi:hypothetical protein